MLDKIKISLDDGTILSFGALDSPASSRLKNELAVAFQPDILLAKASFKLYHY